MEVAVTNLTLVQAQDRYVGRVRSCQTGHARRVRRAAWRELAEWARKHGYDERTVCVDADDMLKLEQGVDE
jgi:hypothetical protein